MSVTLGDCQGDCGCLDAPVKIGPAPEIRPSVKLKLAYEVFRSLLDGTQPPDTVQPVASPEYLTEAEQHLCLLSEAIKGYLEIVCDRVEQITPGLELCEPQHTISDLMDDVCFAIECARERMIGADCQRGSVQEFNGRGMYVADGLTAREIAAGANELIVNFEIAPYTAQAMASAVLLASAKAAKT